MKTNVTIKLVCCLMMVTATAYTHSETFTLPIASQGQHLQHIERPQLGQKQAAVIAQFGNAIKRHTPSGNPIITRWDYSQFSVYFEDDVVLHSVLRHQRQDSKAPQPRAGE